MSRRAVLPLILLVGAAASPAAAGETACWFENGAVVVPAEIGGVAGDWLLDPSAPHTLLHETRAEMEGLPATFETHGRLAGERLTAVDVTVADLDDRAPGFSTPIAGVIGADVMAGYVVDLQFAPCVVRISRGPSRPRGGSRVLPLTTAGGVPAVRAAISDDRRARTGLFAVDWSSRAAVRLSGARLDGAAADLDPTLRNRAPGRLRALSVDGKLYEQQTAALAPDLDPSLAGALGVGFWSRWRLRLDIGHGSLSLSPQ